MRTEVSALFQNSCTSKYHKDGGEESELEVYYGLFILVVFKWFLLSIEDDQSFIKVNLYSFDYLC